MVRRRRKKRDVMFLIAAALIIAFIWGAFEFGGDGDDEVQGDPLDTDGDGLLDSWEMTHFSGLAQGPGDDPDNDGLTNLEEYEAGSDPNVAPPPPEFTFEIWLFDAQMNYTYNLSLQVDGVDLFTDDLTLSKQRATANFIGPEGNHTFTASANNASNNLTFPEETYKLTNGDSILVEVWESVIHIHINVTVPAEPVCGGA